jgi:hypothetical protein
MLGALRSANALRFGKNILGNTTATYTMVDIVNDIAALGGIPYSAAATTFQMQASGYTYTFTLTPTPQAPTTFGSITAGAGTYATW